MQKRFNFTNRMHLSTVPDFRMVMFMSMSIELLPGLKEFVILVFISLTFSMAEAARNCAQPDCELYRLITFITGRTPSMSIAPMDEMEDVEEDAALIPPEQEEVLQDQGGIIPEEEEEEEEVVPDELEDAALVPQEEEEELEEDKGGVIRTEEEELEMHQLMLIPFPSEVHEQAGLDASDIQAPVVCSCYLLNEIIAHLQIPRDPNFILPLVPIGGHNILTVG